jgi:hypothetical protein
VHFLLTLRISNNFANNLILHSNYLILLSCFTISHDLCKQVAVKNRATVCGANHLGFNICETEFRALTQMLLLLHVVLYS